MRLKNIFVLVLIVLVLILGSFQLFSYFYFPDYFFNEQVESHLVSAVEGRGERLDDYLSERVLDVESLARDRDVLDFLDSGLVVDEKAALDVVEFRVGVAVDQVGIFLDKYPDMTFEELMGDEEFLGIVEIGFGESGQSYLINMDGDLEDYFYYEDSGVLSGDGVRVGIGVKLDARDFQSFGFDSDFDKEMRSTGKGRFYRVVVRDKNDFVMFRNHDVGGPGHVERLAGKRANGRWATVAWLIDKRDAHIERGYLVGDTEDVRDVLKRLRRKPRHVKGDIFMAGPEIKGSERDKK